MKRQALVVLAWLLVGCGYGGDASEGPYETYPCGSPRQALIDTGAELELDAGKGVGLLMEYLGDGEWRVRTSCDTRRSGYDCDWDILIWAEEGNTLSDFTGEDLEAVASGTERSTSGGSRAPTSTASRSRPLLARRCGSTRCSTARARTRTCTGSETVPCTPGHLRIRSI
jgi:hypothetical protein